MGATLHSADEEHAKVLQVVGVNEDPRRRGALHGQIDGACKHTAAALVTAQKAPKRLLAVSLRSTRTLLVAASPDSAK